MSLTSKQIDELRAYAKDRKGELAKLINDAADTIEMLSAKLLDAFQDESSHSLIFGYPLEYLVAFAEACRKAGVDESDLKTFANNCIFAYATMEEEYRQTINRAIDAFMGNAGGTNDSD